VRTKHPLEERGVLLRTIGNRQDCRTSRGLKLGTTNTNPVVSILIFSHFSKKLTNLIMLFFGGANAHSEELLRDTPN